MKHFIKAYLTRNKIDINSLANFIIEYCELCKKPKPNPEQLNAIVTGISFNIFDLSYMVNNAIELLNLPITSVHDKNGNLIKYLFDY